MAYLVIDDGAFGRSARLGRTEAWGARFTPNSRGAHPCLATTTLE